MRCQINNPLTVLHIDYTLSIIIIDKVNTKSVMDDLTLKELVESFHSLQVTPQLLSNFNNLSLIFFLINAYSHNYIVEFVRKQENYATLQNDRKYRQKIKSATFGILSKYFEFEQVLKLLPIIIIKLIIIQQIIIMIITVGAAGTAINKLSI